MLKIVTRFKNRIVESIIRLIDIRIKLLLGNSPQHYTNCDIKFDSKITADSQIGEYTYVGYQCVITKATIGRYCSIGDHVTIGPGEHSLTSISTSHFIGMNDYAMLTSKPCSIGNDVWIGTDAIILRGIEIGDGAVIGANSVVTKNIPPFAIAVGSPARIIKYRFNEDVQKKISEIRWWDLDKETAKAMVDKLSNEL